MFFGNKTKQALSYIKESHHYRYTDVEKIALLDKSINLDPTIVEAYVTRGMYYNVIGRKDLSYADYTTAISLDSTSADVYYQRASLYLDLPNAKPIPNNKRKFSQSINDLNNAVRLDPNNIEYLRKRMYAYKNYGDLDKANGDLDKAIDDCNKLCILEPCSIENRVVMILFYMRKDLDKAFAYVNQCLRDMSNGDFYALRADIYSRKGDSDNAIADYTEFLSYFPKNALYYNARGNEYNKKGDLLNAKRDFDKADRIDQINEQMDKQMDKRIHCVRCQSTQLTTNDKGFNLGYAAIGDILIGPKGLLGGLIGSKDVVITCLKCGHKWNPGER